MLISSPNKISSAIIVGSSRGLGLGLVSAYINLDWRVIATVRNKSKCLELNRMLASNPDRLRLEKLDITNRDMLMELASRIEDASQQLLCVNAGISFGSAEKINETSCEDFNNIMITNAYSPMQVIDELAQKVTPDGVIAVMSSGLASVENNVTGGWESYRASKAALNMLVKSRAAEATDDRTYLCLSPGWVKTDMGGADAPLDIIESVRGLIAAISEHRKTGGVHFVNYLGEAVAW